MNYYFFIDESGDHGLTKVDTDFPVFLLCGVLIKEEDYQIVRQAALSVIIGGLNFPVASVWEIPQ